MLDLTRLESQGLILTVVEGGTIVSATKPSEQEMKKARTWYKKNKKKIAKKKALRKNKAKDPAKKKAGLKASKTAKKRYGKTGKKVK